MKILPPLALVLFPAILAAQTNIGPLTLGKPLPNLPLCKGEPDRLNGFRGQGPCQYFLFPGMDSTQYPGASSHFQIRNIPWDGAEPTVEPRDACWKRVPSNQPWSTQCPVEYIAFEVADLDCNKVLEALRKKFGEPRVSSEWVQNGFGARWQRVHYAWSRNGDLLTYTEHYRFRGCFFNARTKAYEAEMNRKDELNF